MNFMVVSFLTKIIFEHVTCENKKWDQIFFLSKFKVNLDLTYYFIHTKYNTHGLTFYISLTILFLRLVTEI